MTKLEELKKDVETETVERFLDRLRDNLDFDGDQVRESLQDDGSDHEIADSNVPAMNYDIMEMASDPEIWGHENELGPAFDGTPTITNITAGSIYEVLYEQVNETLEKMAYELDETIEDIMTDHEIDDREKAISDWIEECET